MRKQIRRIRWAIRNHNVRNFIIGIVLLCTSSFLVLAVLGECSQFGSFAFITKFTRCKSSEHERDEVVIERLNATLISSVDIYPSRKTNLGESRPVPGVLAPSLLPPTSTLFPPTTVFIPQPQELHDEDEDNGKLVTDLIFEERKEEAAKVCADMLNTELYRETFPNDDGSGKFSKNETVPLGRLVQSAVFDKNLIHLIKYRGTVHKMPKYFQTAGLKKNRMIYFHRIVKSTTNPAESKVVELKWCPIFKAASTPWLAVFTKLSHALTNYTEAQIKHGKLGFMELAKTFRLLTPRIYDKSIRVTRYSMVVVRHPFKRLLSAYRDKIERVNGRMYYYKKYSAKIISRFRKSGIGAAVPYAKGRDSLVKIPTFEEFVHYVLSTDPRKLDEHWRPMFLDCNPCQRTFDFILKVETLDDDKQKVLEHLQLTPSDPQKKEVEDVWVRWNNPSGRNEPNRNESFYFSQLSPKDMEQLYDLYEPDFRIFGYSPYHYFDMTNRDNVSDLAHVTSRL